MATRRKQRYDLTHRLSMEAQRKVITILIYDSKNPKVASAFGGGK